MTGADLRAVLEAVVYGDDPRITPGERVRAAEQLRALEPQQPQDFRHLLERMHPDEAAQLYDEYLGAELARELLDDGPEARRQPVLARTLQAEVEARAQALAAQQLAAVEAEVEQRAHALAAQLYRRRAPFGSAAAAYPGVSASPALQEAAAVTA